MTALATLLILAALALWLLAARAVWRDLRRPSTCSAAQARCGLPGPLGQSPARRWWRDNRPHLAHPRRHGPA